MEDTERKDLDETRRLLYMALVAGQTDRYNLVGTLANAMIHHSGVWQAEPDELLDQLVGLVDSSRNASPERALAFETIRGLTARLESAGAPAGSAGQDDPGSEGS